MPDANQHACRWERFRELMPVTRKWAYFDNAAVGPLPTPVREAVLRWADEGWKEGDTVWSQWAAGIEQTRCQAAEMIAASTAEIVIQLPDGAPPSIFKGSTARTCRADRR